MILMQTHPLQLFNYESRNYKPAIIFPNFFFFPSQNTSNLSFLKFLSIPSNRKKKEEETKQSLFPISLKPRIYFPKYFPPRSSKRSKKKKINQSINHLPKKSPKQSNQPHNSHHSTTL